MSYLNLLYTLHANQMNWTNFTFQTNLFNKSLIHSTIICSWIGLIQFLKSAWTGNLLNLQYCDVFSEWNGKILNELNRGCGLYFHDFQLIGSRKVGFPFNSLKQCSTQAVKLMSWSGHWLKITKAKKKKIVD